MILDFAARRAELTPDRRAVWFEGHWHDYRELDVRARRLAARLAEAGVGPGDRVSILAQNHLAHIDLILATAKLGFAYTPFNHRLGEVELTRLAEYAKPAFLLFDDTNARKAAAISAVPRLRLNEYEGWLAGAGTIGSYHRPEPEEIQMILFTGGTTGTPKGAMLPYRQNFYNGVNTVFSWGLRDDDCVIQATPCFHAAVNAFTTPLLQLGARVVMQGSFDPGEYLRLVEEQRATILFLVPTMYQMLARHPEFESADLSSVRWAISGGAPCPEPVREAFAQRGIDFKQGYGLTEAGVNCFAIELEEAALRPGSVGKPMLHARAAIRHPSGDEVGPGEVGELTLAGPHLFAGYLADPDATAEVLRDGWLWTGDLAREDEEGYFYLVGRRKEMFISGGENVFPVEIENVLYRHPSVAECTVVGVPDEHWGEVGVAAVVLAGGQAQEPAPLIDELREFVASQLARYKVPKRFILLSELPKSGAGKVLKREIVAMAGREQEGSGR